MKYKIPISVSRIEDGSFMARSEALKATATGNTPEDVIINLREAIRDMVEAFGIERVFADLQPETDYQIMEIAL